MGVSEPTQACSYSDQFLETVYMSLSLLKYYETLLFLLHCACVEFLSKYFQADDNIDVCR